MPLIIEGNLTFDFPPSWTALKYDRSQFYLNEFQHSAKAVDILAIEPTACCWLIEIKDYRKGHKTSAVRLAGVVAQKVRDTLAGLATARVRATGNDQRVAQASMTCSDLRVVLHMENPAVTSILFSRAINPANVQSELRRKVGAIDSRFQVVDAQSCLHLPWTVQ